jgi:hypothetical protein
MRIRILLRYLCVLAALAGLFAAVSFAQDGASVVRLVNVHQGMKLVSTAREQREQVKGKPDCSHLVHRIYELSGFPYPYASSFDLYDGIDNFRQVSTPRAGDLVVWRGHVGIVVNAGQHTFYSSVSSGFRTEYYDGPYWREQGRQRFYRYVLPGPAELTATNASAPVINSATQSKISTVPGRKEVADAPSFGPGLPTKAESLEVSRGPSSPLNHPFTLPSSIMVVAAANRPTEKEIGEAISEFNSAAGDLLRSWPSADPKRIILVYDQLRIQHVELKGDKGWASAGIEGRLLIGDKGIERQRRGEQMRWELRHTPQGWQLLAPANRAYVPRDVAVRVLAGQLAFLAQNEAADDLDRSVHQQSVIVGALGFLFDPQ